MSCCAPVFAELYHLSASQTALLVAVPVLLGSLARLPMGMLTDRYGGRVMFTTLLLLSAVAAWMVSFTSSDRGRCRASRSSCAATRSTRPASR